MDISKIIIENSSYKDADGFVFYSNNSEKVYRQINSGYIDTYLNLKQNGIYDVLIENKFILPFEETNDKEKVILETDKINFISYPYEWGFEQMKSASVFYLELLEFCLEKNIFIKDASPFNIQFVYGKPIFIDLLSFEVYKDNSPWLGYRQFCEMFIAPLVLSKYFNANFNRELILNLEGVELKKTAKLLPFKACFNSIALFHIIAHSKAIGKGNSEKKIEISKKKTLSIIAHLKDGIKNLKRNKTFSNWTKYSETLPYSEDEIKIKKQTIAEWTENKNFNIVLDAGANHTIFSEIISKKSKQIIAIDNDTNIIDKIFIENKQNILPLNIDITQVTPAIGINLNERKSFFERLNSDLTLALALTHHLFHSRNIPLPKIAETFSNCSPTLIIEFISETDEMFLKIQNRNNKHPYSKLHFEEAFEKYFSIEAIKEIKQNKRYLYLMIRK